MLGTSTARNRADNDNYKAHAEDGMHCLTMDSPIAPESMYYGFVVTGEDTTISSITYRDTTLITGDLTAITLPQGGYIPISSGFTTLTLTNGDMLLLKKEI